MHTCTHAHVHMCMHMQYTHMQHMHAHATHMLHTYIGALVIVCLDCCFVLFNIECVIVHSISDTLFLFVCNYTQDKMSTTSKVNPSLWMMREPPNSQETFPIHLLMLLLSLSIHLLSLSIPLLPPCTDLV